MDKPQDTQLDSPTDAVIAPGFVMLRSAIRADEEELLMSISKSLEGKFLVSRPSVLRIYDVLDNYPQHQLLRSICERLVGVAKRIDDQMPGMNPTHLMLLHYLSDKGMPWHADMGANDGSNDRPIVSVSIGDTCRFGYMIGRKKHYTELRSGDVAIWGGPMRLMKHCAEVSINTDENGTGRYNFTFRDAPEIYWRLNIGSSYPGATTTPAMSQ